MLKRIIGPVPLSGNNLNNTPLISASGPTSLGSGGVPSVSGSDSMELGLWDRFPAEDHEDSPLPPKVGMMMMW